MTDTGTPLEWSPGMLPREADKPKHPAPKGEGAAGTQHLSSLSQRGRAPASPPLPNTELRLLSVTSPGRGLPYCIYATKLAADA